MSEALLVNEPATTTGSGPRSIPSGRSLALRAAAAAALCGLGLLAARVVTATGGASAGRLGELIARLDAGAPVLVAIGSAVVIAPFVAARLDGAPRPSARRLLARLAVTAYALWLPIVVVNEVMVDPEWSPGSLLQTLVFFRDLGSAPATGLSMGLVVFLVASVAVVAPVVDRLVPRVDDESGRLYRIASSLVVAGPVVRFALFAWGFDAPFGARSWLPAHLDLVGLALAAVVAMRTGVLARLGERSLVAGWVLVAGGLLGATLASDALEPVVGSADAQVRALLFAVIAAGALVVVATPRRPRAGRGVGRAMVALAVVAPGLVLAHEPSFLLMARQYRVRFGVDALGRVTLDGSGLPVWLWSACVAAAFGAVLTLGVLAPLHRRFLGAWPAAMYALALGGVVAGGLLVRLIGWLALAPEKVDAGDPLFYHVTANVLAEGRGFPEPLNWLDTATHIPSALHGPLYPIVLSFASRLGGTTWVDHRFVSVLIGTATVLVTALVARRVGGRRAAVAAAVLAAVYPNLWLIDGLMYPEGLFALLTTACVLVAYRWREHPTVWAAAGLGALIGLAGLTRGEGLLLGPLLAAPWMLAFKPMALGDRWRHLAVAGLACIGVLAPWTARNVMQFEEFVPLSTNGNELIMYANCDDVYSGSHIGYWSFACQERYRAEHGEPSGDESEKAAFWRDVGVDYARDHLDDVPRVVAARVLRQWELFRPAQNAELVSIEGRDPNASRAGLVMYYGLVGASVAGVVMLRRRRVPLLPLGAQFVSVTATAIYAYATVRFRAPVEPVLCVLAGVAVVPLLPRVRQWVAPPDLVPDERPPPAHDESAFVLGGRGGLRRRRFGAVAGWLSIAIVAAFVLLPLRGLLRTTGGTMEEGFMLYFPERLRAGDVPNVDFLHLYGPGSLHALMAWYEIVGNTLTAERIFGLFQHMGIIFGLYALGRAWGRAAAVAVAVASVFLVLTPIALQAMAWNGGLALAIWAIVFAVRATNLDTSTSRRNAWIAAGVLGGLSLTFRPDLILALALGGGWLLWQNRSAWRPVLIGALVGAIPMWVHLGMAGPSASFEGMVLDPVFNLRPGRELPSPPDWSRLGGALQELAEDAPPWWGFPALRASQSLFIWFFAMIAVNIGLVALAWYLHRRTGGSPRTVVLMAGSLLALGVLPQALQRPDSTHLSWVTCLSWPMVILAVIELVRLRRPATHPRTALTLGAAAVAISMFVVAPLYTYRYYLQSVRMTVGDIPAAFPVDRNGRRFYMGAQQAQRASQAAVDTLGALAQPGDRLLVGPKDLARTPYNDAYLYWLLPELDPATYFIEMDPGLANAEDSGLADDVASADWLLLTGFWAGWYEPNTSIVDGSQEPNEVVREQFCRVDSWEDELIVLYRRCDAD